MRTAPAVFAASGRLPSIAAISSTGVLRLMAASSPSTRTWWGISYFDLGICVKSARSCEHLLDVRQSCEHFPPLVEAPRWCTRVFEHDRPIQFDRPRPEITLSISIKFTKETNISKNVAPRIP
jgi:hypothetical protein